MRDGGVNKTDILSLVKILTLWEKNKPNQTNKPTTSGKYQVFSGQHNVYHQSPNKESALLYSARLRKFGDEPFCVLGSKCH